MQNALSTTEGAVLGLVAFKERTGYELSRYAARTVRHLWTPSQSQIYKTLPRLVAGELATRREVEQQGTPDKALYRITAAGRRALRSWLDEVEEEPASGRVVFPLKLFFCKFASTGTAELQLAAYRGYLMRRLRQYEALRDPQRRGPDDYPQHVLEHGIARIQATLHWIDATASAIEGIPVQSESRGRRAQKPIG